MKGAAMFTAILLALAALLGPAAAPSSAKPAVAAPGEARLFLFPASGGAEALTMTLI
jgi:hypothetical protein